MSWQAAQLLVIYRTGDGIMADHMSEEIGGLVMRMPKLNCNFECYFENIKFLQYTPQTAGVKVLVKFVKGGGGVN